jgi:Leucine-rich repeat (LRR) protein
MASLVDIIENARRSHHSILHLNYQRLTCLPDALIQPPLSTVVKKLYLKRNLLTHLTPEISHLTNLVELYLHSNFLGALPPGN